MADSTSILRAIVSHAVTMALNSFQWSIIFGNVTILENHICHYIMLSFYVTALFQHCGRPDEVQVQFGNASIRYSFLIIAINSF